MDLDEIEQRLRAGEWLSTPVVANLFGRSRTTIYRWWQSGLLAGEQDPVSGAVRLDPVTVLALLERFKGMRRHGRLSPPG